MSTTAAQGLRKHPVDAKPAAAPEGVAAHEALRAARADLAEAERRLRESEERWGLLALASQDGIWDWVPGSDPMDWSAQFTRMLGYTDGEIVPSVTAFNALLHPDDSAAVWRAFDEHLAGKTELFEFEYRVRAKDGSHRRIRSRGKAKLDERGTAVRMVCLHADITAGNAEENAAPRPQKVTGSAEPRVATTHCKTCNSELLFRSRWRLWERPMIFLLQRPVRCRSCGRRSFKPVWAGVPRASKAYRRYSNAPSDA